MDLTVAERAQLQAIKDRLGSLKTFLDQHPTPDVGSAFLDWHKHLLRVKEIVGNSNNNDSFVACLMAKEYLYHKLPMRSFDVGTKAQGAPGLDIDANDYRWQPCYWGDQDNYSVYGERFGSSTENDLQKGF